MLKKPRRCRRSRFLQSEVCGLALLLPALALAGCTDTTDDAAAMTGVVLDAELDPGASSIAYPIDHFFATRDDSEVLGFASQIAAAACAAEQGVHYKIPTRETPVEYDQDTLDGPWTIAQAERFAFVMPMTDADLRGNGVVGAPEAPVEEPSTDRTLADVPDDSPEREIVEECFRVNAETVDYESAQNPAGSWVLELETAVSVAQHSAEADDLRSELRACYLSSGVAVDEAAFTSGVLGDTAGAAGADSSRIDAEQIVLAVAVVGCKDEVQYTERAAQLIAEAQVPVVLANLDELRAFAENLAQTRAEAEEVIAEHADLRTTW